MSRNPPPLANTEALEHLSTRILRLVHDARHRALQAADTIQVHTCWEIGRHIIEFEQAGQQRAAYGARLLGNLAARLTADLGAGFDESNLRNMRQFFSTYPNRDAVRRELSWTHYRTLLRVDSEAARTWYESEAAEQGWSTRVLQRHIGTLYYERLLSSRDRPAVAAEAADAAAKVEKLAPRQFVRDPIVLEFLGLQGAGRLLEADLERALIENLQAFLLELGKGFAFVGRQQRVSTETKDFFVDLVFYNLDSHENQPPLSHQNGPPA